MEKGASCVHCAVHRALDEFIFEKWYIHQSMQGFSFKHVEKHACCSLFSRFFLGWFCYVSMLLLRFPMSISHVLNFTVLTVFQI